MPHVPRPRPLAKKIRNWLLRAGCRTAAAPAMPLGFSSQVLWRLDRIHISPIKADGTAVSIVPFPQGYKGALCFSVDFDNPVSHHYLKPFFAEGTRALIGLSEKYRIPLTWAICGQTASEEPELFREIVSSKAPKELAFHSFSHLDISDPHVEEATIQEDFSRGVKLLQEFGQPTSFIFPFNKEGRHELLTKFGFTSYRGFNGGHVLAYPSLRNDLWNIQASCYIREAQPYASLPEALLRLAVRSGTVAHLWTHPWSIQTRGDVAKFARTVLEPTFSLASRMREEGKLWTATMREISSYCEARFHGTIEQLQIEKTQVRYVSRLHTLDSSRMPPREVTFRVRFPRPKERYKALLDDHAYAQGSASHRMFREAFLNVQLDQKPKEFKVSWE